MLSMRLMFNLRSIASQLLKVNGVARYSFRNISNKEKTNEGITAFTFEDAEDEEEVRAREAAIEQKRNKSRLFPQDYNKQHGRVPYETPEWELHESLIYRRRLYGKYGESSKVDVSILWPSKIELAAIKEYETISQPFTLKEMIDKMREKKALAEKERLEAEAEVLEKVSRIKHELLEFHKKVAIKKEKARQLMEEKNKLIKQVQEHFGYDMDPRDERFIAMLEQIKKEEKKKAKAEKKAKRELKVDFHSKALDKSSDSLLEN